MFLIPACEEDSLLDWLLKKKQNAQNEKNSDLCCLSYPCCGVVRGPSKSTLNRKEGFLLEMVLPSLGSVSQGGAHCPNGDHLPPPRPPQGRPLGKGTQTDPRLRPQQCRPGCLWGQRAVPHFLPKNNKKEMKADALQRKDQVNLHVHNLHMCSICLFVYLCIRQKKLRMTEVIHKRGEIRIGTCCRLDSNLQLSHEHHCSKYHHNVYIH